MDAVEFVKIGKQKLHIDLLSRPLHIGCKVYKPVDLPPDNFNRIAHVVKQCGKTPTIKEFLVLRVVGIWIVLFIHNSLVKGHPILGILCKDAQAKDEYIDRMYIVIALLID